MKTVDYYMELPYRMEIIPDKRKVDLLQHFRICQDVSLSEIQLRWLFII